MNTKLKRFIKISVIILTIISLIGLLEIFKFIYIIELKPETILEYKCNINNYKIEFKSIGEPKWPFGSAKAKIILKDSSNKKIESINEIVENDGKTLSEENIEVTCFNDFVQIIIKGEEQQDSIHKIKYRK